MFTVEEKTCTSRKDSARETERLSPAPIMTLKIRYLNSGVRSRDLKGLCAHPDSAFSETAVMVKDGTRNTLHQVTIDIGDLVIKRYNTKNAWHLARRNFQTSRALNCWHMGTLFRSKGIDTPEPMAVVEDQRGPFSGRSWYICRYVGNTLLPDYLDSADWEDRFELIKIRVCELFQTLQSHRFSHGDLKGSNLLVHEDRLTVVDLDAAKQHRSPLLHRLAFDNDKARFLKNWNGAPEIQHRFSTLLSEKGL